MLKKCGTQVYNIGSDKEIAILDLAKQIVTLTRSTCKINFSKRPFHDHQRRLPSLVKMQSLGWKQTVSLEEGLKKCLNK